MPSSAFEFKGKDDQTLVGRLERPAGPVQATALFAHCFTSGKDIFAARRISRRLAAMGIAVLRFDFTGLGHSDGELANSGFSGNVDDLLEEAADFYDAELEYDVKKLGAAIEPILIVCIAGMVLVLALGVFLPIWDLASAAK